MFSLSLNPLKQNSENVCENVCAYSWHFSPSPDAVLTPMAPQDWLVRTSPVNSILWYPMVISQPASYLLSLHLTLGLPFFQQDLIPSYKTSLNFF